MSSPRPNGKRIALDAYITPAPLALAVCRRLAAMGLLFDGATVLEPSVGTGVWIDALAQVEQERGWTFQILAVDINPDALGLRHPRTAQAKVGDCLAQGFKADLADLVLGNPPFSNVPPDAKKGPVVAHLHVDAGLVAAPVCVMLVRCGLLTTSEKRPWALTRPPAHRFELWPRPGFTNEGTDSCEYLAGVWTRQRPLVTTSEILDWRRVGVIAINPAPR